MDERQAAEEAYRFLRRHTTGDLRFDERFRLLRYVIGPDGRLVAPVMFAMLEASDTVLFVPEDMDNAMELLVSLTEFDPEGEHGALTDRWRIYHGDPEDIYWAFIHVDAARYEGQVVDGEGLIQANPLAGDEARLCRQINENHRAELRQVCRVIAQAEVEHPMLVGVDRLGFDVRRRFDVLRVDAPQPMTTAADAELVLGQMIEQAVSAAPNHDAEG